MRYIKVGFILLFVCVVGFWCVFPIRYSREYTHIFQEKKAESYQSLINLLYRDYWQYSENDNILCYNVVYKENAAVSLVRRGKLKEIKVIDEEAILEKLNLFPKTLLPRIENIYVSPSRIKFSTHMSIEYIFYQEKIPWTFFSEKGTNNHYLYRLTKDWYYAFSTAK